MTPQVYHQGNRALPCGVLPRLEGLRAVGREGVGFPAQGAVWRRAQDRLSLRQHIFSLSIARDDPRPLPRQETCGSVSSGILVISERGSSFTALIPWTLVLTGDINPLVGVALPVREECPLATTQGDPGICCQAALSGQRVPQASASPGRSLHPCWQ